MWEGIIASIDGAKGGVLTSTLTPGGATSLLSSGSI
jgi:hypothetical protein